MAVDKVASMQLGADEQAFRPVSLANSCNASDRRLREISWDRIPKGNGEEVVPMDIAEKRCPRFMKSLLLPAVLQDAPSPSRMGGLCHRPARAALQSITALARTSEPFTTLASASQTYLQRTALAASVVAPLFPFSSGNSRSGAETGPPPVKGP